MKDLSKLSKITGVVYVAIGVFLILLGFFRPTVPDGFKIYWMASFGALMLGIINLSLKEGIKTSTYISRVLVGALFIVSGLIKANDTIGFSFKLEEYFAENALGWTIFEPYSLFFSIVIAASEVVLGLAVLFGALIRISSWALLGMILFFTGLTYYTATCDKNDKYLIQDTVYENDSRYDKYINTSKDSISVESVGFNFVSEAPDNEEGQKGIVIEESRSVNCVTDCGCFGDALKGSVGRSLTPWESFYKDITLLVFVMMIFIMQRKISFNTTKEDWYILPGALLFNVIVGAWLFGWWFPLIFTAIIIVVYLLLKKMVSKNKQIWFTALFSILMSFGFALYTYKYLPIKDYRAYAIGENILENMMTVQERQARGEDVKAPVYVYNYKFEDKRTGKMKMIRSDVYTSDPALWGDSLLTLVLNDKLGNPIDYEPFKIEDGYEPTITDLSIKAYYSETDVNLLSDSALAEQIEMEYDPGYTEMYYFMENSETKEHIMIPYYDMPKYDSTWAKLQSFDSIVVPANDPQLDVTKALLKREKLLMIISYDYEKANKDVFGDLTKLVEEARSSGIDVCMVSYVNDENKKELKEKYHLNIPFYSCDATELKIIVRSNPGIVYLENATVKGKWDYNRIPGIDELKK